MTQPTFKFGIMLNRMQLYPWQIEVYEEIMKTGLASCELLIIKEEAPTPNTSFIKKITNPHLLFEQYKKRKLNTHLYKPTEYTPIRSIEQLQVKTITKGKANEWIAEEDIKIIKAKDLDFIIRFGFGILKGDILHAAKWGIWSFHHGNEQEFRGGPAGFWEIFKGVRTQGVILQQLTEKLDAGKIILKREYVVTSHSYVENVTKLHMDSTDMPAQAIRMLANDLIDITELKEVKTKAPVYHYPNNFQFIWFLLKILKNKFRLKWMILFKQENWIIAYKKNKDDKYTYIAPSKGGEYYADPFVLTDKGKSYILAEHYSYRTKKGSIVLIEPGMNQIKTLLEKDTHLSYPFVFEENGNMYVLPEEANTGLLSLYKWNGDTKELELIKPILSVPAVDASILKHEGKYYLFTGIKGELPNGKLFIYYADHLEGPYLPHASNPVKVSPKGSRMAGGFVMENNEILRPSQYSVKYYGEKVVFQKIMKLSPTEYQEEIYDELTPEAGAPFKCGLHTYHKNANFEVIDLKTMRSGYIAFKAQL